MSKRRLLLVVVPALVLAVGAVAGWYVWPRKTVLTLDITGTEGIIVQGTIEVDGKTEEVSGTVPKQVVLEGYRLSYALMSADDTGEFRVRALLGERAQGSAGSLSPPRLAVHGWAKSRWGGAAPEVWIGSLEKSEMVR